MLVPIVTIEPGEKPQVDLRRVISGAVLVPHFRVEVRDLWRLCLSVAGGLRLDRGEMPAEAFIECPPGYETSLVHGQSPALAMALVSLSASHGIPLRRPVVATGALNQRGTGEVEPVDHLKLKLETAIEETRGDCFILYPSSSVSDTDAAWLEPLQKQAGQRLRAVSTLEEAADHCFGAGAFSRSPIAELRLRVESLRYERGQAEAFLLACSELYDEASRAPEGSPIRSVGRYHALVCAYFGLHQLDQEHMTVVHWAGRAEAPGDLAQSLQREIDQEYPSSLSHRVPVELRAAYLNFRAVRSFVTLDYVNGLRQAEDGIRLMVDTKSQQQAWNAPHSEHRKLVGTAAQLAARLGVRALSAGLVSLATPLLHSARAYVEDAWRAAQSSEVGLQDDYARVAVYRAAVLVAQAAGGTDVLGPAPLAIARQELQRVLGSVGAPNAAPHVPPMQDPRWALAVLYRALALSHSWPRVLEHWSTARTADWQGESIEAAILNDSSPHILNADIAALLLEAALHAEDAEVARAATSVDWLPGADRAWTLYEIVHAWHVGWAQRIFGVNAPSLKPWLAGPPPLEAVARVAHAEPLVQSNLQTLVQAWHDQDWVAGEEARRRLLAWLGEPVSLGAPPQPRLQLAPPAIERVRIEKGRTVPFNALPDRSVALDGYVVGPHVDPQRRRFSFDHHGSVLRHATLSTCEMVLDAVRVGLEPHDLTIYLNDLDPDSVVATWLLLRPEAATSQAVTFAVRSLGRYDALGPADPGPGLVPGLRRALAPLFTDRLRMGDVEEQRARLTLCLEHLDTWFARGAPQPADVVPAGPLSTPISVQHEGDGWAIFSGQGVTDLQQVYQLGYGAGIIAEPLPDGTMAYHIGKKSELVPSFNVPRILAALGAAELEINPNQSPEHNWGGGTTVGGAPRNVDGSASRLPVDRVVELVEAHR